MKLTQEQKKIVIIGMQIAAFAIALAFLFFNVPVLWSMFLTILGMIQPFLIGLSIAFVVNIPMRRIESLISRLPFGPTLTRALAMLLAYAIIFAFVFLTFAVIIPNVITSMQLFIRAIPDVLRAARSFVQNADWLGSLKESINDAINQVINNVNNLTLQEFINTYFKGVDLQTLISQFAQNILTQLGSVLNITMSSLVSFIFSIYALLSKEKLSRAAKRIIYTFLSERHADTVMYVSYTAFDSFYNFFTGQFLEAILLGTMNYVGMNLLGLEYSLMISLMVMMGALIPLVGAFLAGLLGAFMLLTISPLHAATYLVYLICLQQLEGNVIYPRVVGQQTGLPGILVLLAVLVGAASFGFVGMFLFVPLFSTVHTILMDYTDRRIAEKHLNLERK
ncbi:AI-2E family transporter [Murdochiella vaginalis]|uniref:AI-2E family transporter n=1 Tax=Murdochiella vaginalis TaxID=1852373 RepID=UPI0008FDF6E8|nr:AI-2E family transporter [Murdochiella vaginalis]